MTQKIKAEFPGRFASLWKPSRYKVYYGGRGGAKSWLFARALLIRATQSERRILCAREFQVSIADSVHRLLADQIDSLGLSSVFEITRTEIRCLATGSLFIFRGLHHNAREIKSIEGVDIVWVEEAQHVSADSWDFLIPTIRKKDSEIWISFNPESVDDPTYKQFVLNARPDSIVRKVGYEDNPWFPDTLRAEMEHCRRVDPTKWAHIWGGEPSVITDAVIFKGKYAIDAFETPDVYADHPLINRFYYGADWGFAQDPTALVRCFVMSHREYGENCLYVDYEAGGTGIEIDETPALFDSVPQSRRWPIKADSSRPETISAIRRSGFDIAAAEKWHGSVEDGIAWLRGYDMIVIHPRCKRLLEEMRLYSYKVDKQTRDILPIVVDANNHYIDALRYSQDGLIGKKSASIFDIQWDAVK